MKYFSYFFAWCACVFASSAYYKIFWDRFFTLYYMDFYVSGYGGGVDPAGMPPFNWKINMLVWLSGLAFVGFILFLVTDDVCKGHFKKRKAFPVIVPVINQILAAALYVGLGVLTDYDVRIYYMPIFFLSYIICELFPNAVTVVNLDGWFFFVTLFHALCFSALCMYLYFRERARQMAILRREEEYRRELASAL